MNENSPALRETWKKAETIDDKGIYKKLKYREVEQIGFYIRPMREWFYPCSECQKRLKEQFADARWILGNNEYKPDIELNNVKNELDDSSWITLEEHKATVEEKKRIGVGGWEELDP